MMSLKGASIIKIYKLVRFSRAKCNLTKKIVSYKNITKEKCYQKVGQIYVVNEKNVLSDLNKIFFIFLKDFYVINKDDFW